MTAYDFTLLALRDANNKVITTVGNISNKTNDIFTFSAALKDEADAVPTGGIYLTVQTVGNKTEDIYIKPAGLSADGTQTLAGFVVRGVKVGGNTVVSDLPDASSDYALADIPEGSTIGVAVTPFIAKTWQDKLTGVLPLALQITGTPTWDTPTANTAQNAPTYADDTARDAAITTPVNGMLIYNTASGLFQQYIGGAWTDMASGTTANASETVAGKVEMATLAEQGSQATTGGTGAIVALAASNTVKTADGTPANDENKVPVLNATGTGMEQFSEYASQAEAEAGTAEDKPLNALRVKQAIDAQASGNAIISSDILQSANTERTTYSTSYTKVKEFTVSATGSFRVTLDIRTNYGSQLAYAAVYRNGILVAGTEVSDSSGSWASKTIDMSGFSRDDTLEIWLKHQVGGDASHQSHVQNVDVCATLAPIVTLITD